MSASAIQTESLSKSFGGLHAVVDVSLSIAPGERRVLIGPNGAGKTTLFHCISGTHRPTSGRVLLFDKDISNVAENRRTALGMGRTFQISNICTDLSVRENLQLAAFGNDRRKWVMTRPAGSFADIGDRVERSLQNIGLAPRADELVKFLSYGERRQLELALALNSDPKVLLLDEPCAGLSPSERQGFSRIISALPRDITLLMIEHDIDIALALADRVTVLHRGRVILDGTPGEVQKDEQVREVYFGRV
ncbi:ABC transporter ATP-binding protein [Pseudorhodoplanes sp.]|uniref:ABC transporter ATP-binding protein n=1 Tax=Pseudorhodoplanes sp. TaxID=1934341 RepID=UPI003D127F5E